MMSNQISSLLQGKKVGLTLFISLLFVTSLAGQNGSSELLREEADIIIDHSLGTKGNMMTMEEEIEVYMQLRDAENQALFYPNPSGGKLWLEHNLKGEVSLELRNSSDKLLFTAKDMQVHQLDLHAYAPGHYSIVIYHAGGEKIYSLLIR